MNDEQDAVFSSLKLLTGGCTAPRVAKILNFATSLIEKDECYLEVGTYSGYTLASAGYWNGNRIIGIDKFDFKGQGIKDAEEDVKARCLANLKAYSTNSLLIESDFRNVDLSKLGIKIAVSFIDGKHEHEEVTDNLKWQEQYLADDAVIFFDDVGLKTVDIAIKNWFLMYNKHYDILFYAKPHYLNEESVPVIDQMLHNGLVILRYCKNGF